MTQSLVLVHNSLFGSQPLGYIAGKAAYACDLSFYFIDRVKADLETHQLAAHRVNGFGYDHVALTGQSAAIVPVPFFNFVPGIPGMVMRTTAMHWLIAGKPGYLVAVSLVHINIPHLLINRPD